MKKEILFLRRLSAVNRYQEKLKRIDLLVRQGECHLLWGRDYTARTLAALLRGEGALTGGKIMADGRETACSREAFEKGRIYYVDTAARFLNSLDIAENLFLLKKNSLRKLWINEKAIHRQAEYLIGRYGLGMNAADYPEQLSKADRVLLAILRASGMGARLLVLNNLSAECSCGELKKLKDFLLRLKKEGMAFVIYDSRREAFLDMADVIVLAGRGEIRRKITEKEHFPPGSEGSAVEEAGESANTALKERLTDGTIDHAGENASGREAVFCCSCAEGPFSLSVQAGEILSVSCADAEMQTELWKSLLGEGQGKHTVWLDGREVCYKGCGELTSYRIGFWGGRTEEGEIFPNLSVQDNILLPSMARISRFGLYGKGADYIFHDSFLAGGRMEEAFGGGRLSAGALAENDVLRLILYKWKLFHPRVLLLCNVLSKADIEMKEWIGRELKEMAGRGTCVILLEMAADVLGLADRTVTFPAHWR